MSPCALLIKRKKTLSQSAILPSLSSNMTTVQDLEIYLSTDCPIELKEYLKEFYSDLIDPDFVSSDLLYESIRFSEMKKNDIVLLNIPCQNNNLSLCRAVGFDNQKCACFGRKRWITVFGRCFKDDKQLKTLSTEAKTELRRLKVNSELNVGLIA